jgi:hypothetical protein
VNNLGTGWTVTNVGPTQIIFINVDGINYKVEDLSPRVQDLVAALNNFGISGGQQTRDAIYNELKWCFENEEWLDVDVCYNRAMTVVGRKQ